MADVLSVKKEYIQQYFSPTFWLLMIKTKSLRKSQKLKRKIQIHLNGRGTMKLQNHQQ